MGNLNTKKKTKKKKTQRHSYMIMVIEKWLYEQTRKKKLSSEILNVVMC